jgi:hypothetical protein
MSWRRLRHLPIKMMSLLHLDKLILKNEKKIKIDHSSIFQQKNTQNFNHVISGWTIKPFTPVNNNNVAS